MNRSIITTYAALATVLASAASTPAQEREQVFQTEQANVAAEVIADGLRHPWGLDFLPDGSAIVTERVGEMRILSEGELSEPIEGVPEVWSQGQGGLLDVAVSPDFENDQTIFFTFSDPGEGGAGTALARATLARDGASASLHDVEILFSMDHKTGAGQHFGSRIVFNPDGTIFFTTGDRGDRQRAQDMQDSAGAVLRVNADGSIPADNPYAGGEEALPVIWSKGHRNIQGAAWDPVTGSLWTLEHGARGGDELNRPEGGKNYGWPVIAYGRHYSGARIGEGTEASGYEQPLHYWDPSIAPSGLVVYQGEMFPEWKGDFLVGALKFELVARLERNESGEIAGEERMFEGAFGRIRDVNVAPDGSVWLLTDKDNGEIVRLSRAD